MKKLLALCLIFIGLSMPLLASCSFSNYKPISIKYQNSDYAAYTDGEPKSFLLDLLNNSKWHNGVAKCDCDYTVMMKNMREIFYHSECGTFIDYDLDKSLTVSEEDRLALNGYFTVIMCESNVHCFDENGDYICDSCGYVMPEHEHTGEWHISESTHYYQYTCGCPSPDIAELHSDYDENFICDICEYVMNGHEHTYAYNHDNIGHDWSYTCGCMTPPNFAQHFDGDGDGKCDEDSCGYNMSE